MDRVEKDPSSLPRRIGWFTAGCVLVSNVVGSGIFTTTGFMARDLGDPSLILAVWLVGGMIALAGALSYSELGAALPVAGGEYVYLRRAYGPFVGFLSGWTSFAVGFSAAIAAGAMSFAAYVNQLFHVDGSSTLTANEACSRPSSRWSSSGPPRPITWLEQEQAGFFSGRSPC